jgi:GxxExxY protein
VNPNEITERVIGCAINVHRALGPGLLESAYRICLAEEFRYQGIAFESERAIPVVYRGVTLDCAYRADFLVAGCVVVELKAVIKLDPVFEYQLLTYLKLTGYPVGLLLNFNVPVLKDGIRRKAWNLSAPSETPGLRV